MGQIALHQELSHSFITNITVQLKRNTIFIIRPLVFCFYGVFGCKRILKILVSEQEQI